MAQLVGRAIYRQAHGETKDAELVEKLQTEFAPELAVYMAAPEMKNQSLNLWRLVLFDVRHQALN